jgi:hypothetical protein
MTLNVNMNRVCDQTSKATNEVVGSSLLDTGDTVGWKNSNRDFQEVVSLEHRFFASSLSALIRLVGPNYLLSHSESSWGSWQEPASFLPRGRAETPCGFSL